ncbi:response regulator transcription factor [Nonomuraea fuscirosea]|uniref:response regulator n=1 Tax=Nonomuraea fuscirosea TaxID=1291556 RepID=UPI003434D7BD
MPPAPSIRLVLVEDHAMVAEAIGQALGRAPGIEVVAQAGTIAGAVAETGRCRPDVVVLDRRLPDGDGIAAIGRLTAAAPGVRVLVLPGEATAAVATGVARAPRPGPGPRLGAARRPAAVRRVGQRADRGRRQDGVVRAHREPGADEPASGARPAPWSGPGRRLIAFGAPAGP